MFLAIVAVLEKKGPSGHPVERQCRQMVQRLGSGSWYCEFESSVLPLTSCVILKELYNLPGLSVPTCKMDIIIVLNIYSAELL